MTESNGHTNRNRRRGGYELEQPTLPAPQLPGDVVVALTHDDLIDDVAADLVVHAENCVREFGDFHLALSAGPIFEPLYRRLMYDPNYRRLPWRRTHLWIVEERCVPFEDEQSSTRMISELIGDHADIPREQFHPVFAQSETASADYESQLKEALSWREKGQDRLDYVLLTIGENGWSVGAPARAKDEVEPGRLVRRVTRPLSRSEHADSVCLTDSIINAARFIAVLVTGSAMAGAVEQIARDAARGAEESGEVVLPIQRVQPLNGELRWYLDAPACGVDV